MAAENNDTRESWCDVGDTPTDLCDHCKYHRAQRLAAVVKAAREVCKLTVPQKHSRGPRAFYQLRDALAALDGDV